MSEPSSPIPATDPAAECVRIWQNVLDAQMAKHKPRLYAEEDAGRAFRCAMPSLSGTESIAAYIDCVTRGMLVGAINAPVGAKLLYAAQVALSMHRKPPSKTKAEKA